MDISNNLRPNYNAFLSLLHRSAPVHRSLPDGRGWGKSSDYEVKDGYRAATDLQNNNNDDMKWVKVCYKDRLLKINFFYWTLAHQKMLIVENLRKRGIASPMRCIMCKDSEESLEHHFIECKFFQEIWQWAFKDLNFDLTMPTNWNDFFVCWKDYYQGSLSNKPNFARAWEALPKYIYWNLWTSRNKEIFEGKK